MDHTQADQQEQEPYTTDLSDDDSLNDLVRRLLDPYPVSEAYLRKARKRAPIWVKDDFDKVLKDIIDTLLEIGPPASPVFPLQELLTGPRSGALSCKQAQAASIHHDLLCIDRHAIWISLLHHVVRASVLGDADFDLPKGRAEAAALFSPTAWDSPCNPDPDFKLVGMFMVAIQEDPEQVLQNGPEFTLRKEDGAIIAEADFYEHPPPFIFSADFQDPETGIVTDEPAWQAMSGQLLGDVPSLADRFRAHHRVRPLRRHVITWPPGFLPTTKPLWAYR